MIDLVYDKHTSSAITILLGEDAGNCPLIGLVSASDWDLVKPYSLTLYSTFSADSTIEILSPRRAHVA